jgi:long-chain acyl-CoA synthetase
VYGKHEIVAQSFVYGDSLQSTLVAIVVPDEQPFVNWAHANGFPGKTFAELVADEKVCKAVQKVLDTQGRANGLKGFENVKAVHLTTELFSVENDCMTPTFKMKVIYWFIFSVIKQNSSIVQKLMQCTRLWPSD